LADEAFEYLLGHPRIDDGLRTLLWKHKGQGGFEAAYDEQQTETAKPGRSVAMLNHAQNLEQAIRGMFGDMNKAFAKTKFEFHDANEYSIGKYLGKFDAIFTLNQDLLIEQRYIRGDYLSDSDSRWKRCDTPGVERVWDESTEFIDMIWSPMDDPKGFAIKQDVQPYFKLHGSSNWIDTINGRDVMVLGGNKPAAIDRRRILKWNHEQFNAYLSKPETRLMVIGYSFGDEHINRAIGGAAERGSVRLFIIDPKGVDMDMLNPNVVWSDWAYPAYKLRPYVIGASRRLLSQIFGGSDLVEHGKVMRFFA